MFEGPVTGNIPEVLDGEVTDGTHVTAGQLALALTPYAQVTDTAAVLAGLSNKADQSPFDVLVVATKSTPDGQRSPGGRHRRGADLRALQSTVDTSSEVDSKIAAALLNAVTTAALDAALLGKADASAT